VSCFCIDAAAEEVICITREIVFVPDKHAISLLHRQCNEVDRVSCHYLYPLDPDVCLTGDWMSLSNSLSIWTLKIEFLLAIRYAASMQLQ
jgi:hypothetical protein